MRSLRLPLFSILTVLLLTVVSYGRADAATTRVPHFTISGCQVAEGGDCIFTITKDMAAASYSQLQFGAVDDSAKAGTDYTPTGGVLLTIGNKALSVNVTVHTTDNQVLDGQRRFIGRIAPVRYGIIDKAQADGVILDNEAAPPPTQVPPQTVWTQCAVEGGTCAVVGTANVRYGASGKFVTKAATSSIPCTNAAFGNDPIYGVAKHCDTDGTPGTTTPTPTTNPPPVLSQTTCPDGTVVADPALCPAPPTPTQQPGGWVLASSVTPMATPDFDHLTQGRSKVGVNAAGNSAPSGVPDAVGAFRFICGPGQVLTDDPIVFPNQPGKSHLHQFYGNNGANAYSTYASLRTSGTSSCSGPLQPLNRSAYWMPALLDGLGNVLRPNYVAIYYKRFPKNAPECDPSKGLSGGCTEIPASLKMIAGRDLFDLTAPIPNVQGYQVFHFQCTKPDGSQAKDAKGNASFPDMKQALAVCPAGQGWNLSVELDFPSCWDGLHIDSPDHRSHIAYAPFTAAGQQCPISKQTGTRMKFMPGLKLSAAYSVLSGDQPPLWVLASDAMDPAHPAGSTLHGDYWEGWDPATKTEWTDFCIDKLLSCAGGNLGDGFILTGAQQPPYGFGTTPNRSVPLNAIPQTPVQTSIGG